MGIITESYSLGFICLRSYVWACWLQIKSNKLWHLTRGLWFWKCPVYFNLKSVFCFCVQIIILRGPRIQYHSYLYYCSCVHINWLNILWLDIRYTSQGVQCWFNLTILYSFNSPHILCWEQVMTVNRQPDIYVLIHAFVICAQNGFA